jgi:hypothetical protein
MTRLKLWGHDEVMAGSDHIMANKSGWRFGYWAPLAVYVLMASPTALWGAACRPYAVTESTTPSHDQLSVVGFGAQSSALSFITIRTYETHTGVLVTEESYDLAVQDDRNLEKERADRIFAGGIAAGSDGEVRFLLRVYDPFSGKFLWQGELNLTSKEQEKHARPIATVTHLSPTTWQAGTNKQSAVRLSLSIRAVEPGTGKVVWEDKFSPGVQTTGLADHRRVSSLGDPAASQTVGHIFDLLVRAYDSKSGRLLWGDSFEGTSRIDSMERKDGRLQEQETPFRYEDGSFTPRRNIRNAAMIAGGVVANGIRLPIVAGSGRRKEGVCLA